MATFWITDGNLMVNGSGQPILCDDCPCGCEFLDGDSPAAVQVDISGVVDGTCADCEFWTDNSFLLEGHDPGTCSWSDDFTGWSCNGASSNFLLTITSTLVTLTIGVAGGGSVVFRKSITTPIDFASIGSIPYFTAVGGAATVCDWTAASVDLTAA